MSKFIDITGQKFGKLTASEQNGKNKQGQIQWLCKCECGNQTIVVGYELRRGRTKSCGCLQIKHGKCKSKIYKVWSAMIQRCTNPNNKQYQRYGGRGIKVSQRWKEFTNFLADMGEPPNRYYLDRINNDRGYYKKNCHWISSAESGRNRSNNRMETFNSKTRCRSDWADEYNMTHEILRNRIDRLGWPMSKALNTPIKKYKKRKQ